MTETNSIVKAEHRQKGRGRKAFWIVLGILFLASLFWAIEAPRRESRRMFTDSIASDRNLDRILEVLDADAEQRGILAPVVRRFQSEMSQLRADTVVLRIEFSDALRSGTIPTEDMARFQSTAVGLSETAIANAFQVIADSWDVLTPEQRTEVLRHWDPVG